MWSYFEQGRKEMQQQSSKFPGKSLVLLHRQEDQSQTFIQSDYSPTYSIDIFNWTLHELDHLNIGRNKKQRKCKTPGCSGQMHPGIQTTLTCWVLFPYPVVQNMLEILLWKVILKELRSQLQVD